MTTVNEQIAKLTEEFRKLSKGRQSKLAKDARVFIDQNPGSADNNGFWKGLSARHVLTAFFGR